MAEYIEHMILFIIILIIFIFITIYLVLQEKNNNEEIFKNLPSIRTLDEQKHLAEIGNLKEKNENLKFLLNKNNIELIDVKKELDLLKKTRKENLSNLNVPPNNENLIHYIVLYETIEENDNVTSYKFIRGQLMHVKKILGDIDENKYTIYFKEKYPNPVDLVNRLKEKSKDLNKEVTENINKKFELKYNELVLNSSKIEDVVTILKDLANEQFTIADETM